MNKINNLSFKEVKHRVENALNLLYEKDLFLITNGTNERTITHKLAGYLQLFFPEWYVDCEYNRRGENLPKALPQQDTSYPDIIIHRRNTRENLLIIEAKSIHSQDHTDLTDKIKIKAFIEDERYLYSFGLWICFHDELSHSRLDWFTNVNGRCGQLNI